jgi:hypothetical protein
VAGVTSTFAAPTFSEACAAAGVAPAPIVTAAAAASTALNLVPPIILPFSCPLILFDSAIDCPRYNLKMH